MSHVPCTYFGAKHTLSLRNDKLLWSDRREIIKWNLSNPKINRAVIIYSSVFSGSQARCLPWSVGHCRTDAISDISYVVHCVWTQVSGFYFLQCSYNIDLAHHEELSPSCLEYRKSL